MNADFKINGRVIETNRLRLRPFKESDLDDFFEYAKVAGTGERAGWKHHESKEESKEILDTFIKNDKTFALVYKETNKLIGSIGVEKYGKEAEEIDFANLYGRELGAVLSKDYWNMGLMTEALKAVIDYLFEEMDLDFLTAGYFDNNIPSKKMQEKCGFRHYKKKIFKTRMGSKEPGILNILINPESNLDIDFID